MAQDDTFVGEGAKARVLVVAGVDSSAGAGLSRDLEALRDHGLAARIAVTAVTAQTDQKFIASQSVGGTLLEAQVSAALQEREGGALCAVKVGMLGGTGEVKAVFGALKDCRLPMVVDPVLMSSSGGQLLSEAGCQALLRSIRGRKNAVLTPNLAELTRLCEVLGLEATETEGQAVALANALGLGIVATGGHGVGEELADLVATPGGYFEIRCARVPGQMRGTGCLFSSALACNLGGFMELGEAVGAAQRYVRQRRFKT